MSSYPMVNPGGQKIKSKRRKKGTSRACPHCFRNFNRIEHLDRHVRTHTKERPFVCECSAAFSRRDLLTRHQRREGHGINYSDLTATDAGGIEGIDIDGTSEYPVCNDISTNPNNCATSHKPSEELYLANGHATQNMANLNTPSYNEGQAWNPFMIQNGDFSAFGHFGQFAHVLGDLGLPDEWSPLLQDFDGSQGMTAAQSGSLQDTQVDERMQPEMIESGTSSTERPGTPFDAWLPSAPVGNQAPIKPPNRRIDDATSGIQGWKVSSEQRSHIVQSLENFRDVTGSFTLPSRHTLTRHLTTFFDGFNKNLPFIHHSWRPVDGPIELLLAMCSLGARLCCEHRIADTLYSAGKAIQVSRLHRESGILGPKTAAFLSLNFDVCSDATRRISSISPEGTSDFYEPLDAIRATLLLLCYASWDSKEALVHECFGLANLLAQILIDMGLEEEEEQPTLPTEGSAWKEFIRLESSRRARLSAVGFLNTVGIAYDRFPSLRLDQVRLRLPCLAKEWDATSPTQWKMTATEAHKPQLLLQTALSLLVTHTGSGHPLDPIPTSFGNYLLMHGLVQRIALVRCLSIPLGNAQTALPSEDIEKLERALRAWTVIWQLTPESSVDPCDDVGRIPSTSSVMLTLAYVRIHLNTGPYRELESRDPLRIGTALKRCPLVTRGDSVISALLYATHTLSIPVRLGIDRVARVQVSIWTIRHSLAGLESAIMLSKWLISMAETINTSPLTNAEAKIIYWIRCIITEAQAVTNFDNEDLGSNADFFSMNMAVLGIWVYFFKRNSLNLFINTIGDGLDVYRKLLLEGMI